MNFKKSGNLYRIEISPMNYYYSSRRNQNLEESTRRYQSVKGRYIQHV
jgi:hypothetical protein